MVYSMAVDILSRDRSTEPLTIDIKPLYPKFLGFWVLLMRLGSLLWPLEVTILY